MLKFPKLRHRWARLGAVVPLLAGGMSVELEAACITITNQPKSRYVFPFCPVAFSVGATSAFPLAFQWFTDIGFGPEHIPGGTNSVVVLRPSYSESGIVFAVVTSSCGSVTSSPAFMRVLGDVVPPDLRSASGSANQIVVRFRLGHCESPRNGLYPDSTTNLANYQVSGGVVVSNAQLSCTGTSVLLTTGRLTPGASYAVTVSDVWDASGNSIEPGSQVSFIAAFPADLLPHAIHLTPSPLGTVLEWLGDGALQFAERANGPWNDVVGASSPYLPGVTPPCLNIETEGTPIFFRVRWQE
jgi:hypothetical protein